MTNIFEVDLMYVLSVRKLLHFGGIAYSFEKLTYRYILFQQSNMWSKPQILIANG